MRLLFLFTFLSCALLLQAQDQDTVTYWHNKERTIRYHPEGNDFIITNGNRRFTRALYGTNTGFRVEAGDLPEFAMYMPGMGGNLKFGLSINDSSKWLISADKITARYRAGSMLYDIEDQMLGKGILHLVVLAMSEQEGIVIKMRFENVQSPVKLIWVYGGASGKKFNRDGDMGPDPESSFYLKPEYCTDNSFRISKNTFTLSYGIGVVAEWDPYVNKNFATDTVTAVKTGREQTIAGLVPPSMNIHVADAAMQDNPNQLYHSEQTKTPVITGLLEIRNNESYFFTAQKQDSSKQLSYETVEQSFNQAELVREKLSNRIRVLTPDKYINTIGGVLSTAADAVWESPTYMHGAIGWRMRLNGWRGPYVADVLGWHDRAKTHFKAYALSQVTTPLIGPVVMDTLLHLARSLEKMGTSVFSSGYICRNPGGDFRPHHYDMNLVYIDALFRHFYWTGDLDFAKEIWPVITRHLAWEKRNFDSDDDGLYDAYAAIWASDALEYSGGSVTHSSAYNYKANKEAAIIAKLIGKDGSAYEAEAGKILRAINKILWMSGKGTYAEYKDLMGNKRLHPNPALWTLYHSVDSEVPDAFQSWQCMRYIDKNIPHIPVKAEGLETGYYTLSTSKWMPYDWSLNNVATAEVMHTALSYWQSGQNDKAFNLWKSELLSTMYLGGSPGNIGQISFYDAARGEAYRDFADPVAMTARSLVEGLFGIQPDALRGYFSIKPGFPSSWNFASIQTPDISIDFKRAGQDDSYTIIPAFEKKLQLKLLLKANGSAIKSLIVNGKKTAWKNLPDAIGSPMIEIFAGIQDKYEISISWLAKKTNIRGYREKYIRGSRLNLEFTDASVQKIFDPQQVLIQAEKRRDHISAVIKAATGSHVFFVQIKQGDFTWWEPLEINVCEPVELSAPFKQPRNALQFSILNNTGRVIKGNLVINPRRNEFVKPMELQPGAESMQMKIEPGNLVPGTNEILFSAQDFIFHYDVINWNVERVIKNMQAVDLRKYFNDKVTNIFKNQYLSPRPRVATLQLPVQGIGDWTHPLKTAEIDDQGLRRLAGGNDQIIFPQGILISTPADSLRPNIIFTSQWDNYPNEIRIPLSGSASHAYLLMAGSTNPMQSRFVNGALIITYTDNSADTLLLKNPETWWPIEQDYMDDGFAFTIDAARPVRIHLKTGKIVSDYDNSIEMYNGKMIEGGAATLLDMPLKPGKTLKYLELQTIANDVVIGLMSVSLQRN